MKRVLIVTHYFPPVPAVAGLRPEGLALYLPAFGWEPVIFTPKVPGRRTAGLKVVETGYTYLDISGQPKRLPQNDLRRKVVTFVSRLRTKLNIKPERSALDRLLNLAREITTYPDPERGWRLPAIDEGTRYLQQEPVDAMISTSCHTSHIVAARLKQRFGMTWVADFQDLWTQNHNYHYSRVRKMVERRLELKTLATADALVAAAEDAALRLRELHRGKPVFGITNSFNPAEVNHPPAALTDKFTITYSGIIYPGKQSPEPLFVALKEMIEAGAVEASSVEVRFYGAGLGWVEKQAELHGLRNVVRHLGIVPREVALDRQRESQILLMLKWNDPAQLGIYSTKIFEYLAARRPILAVGGFRDVVSDLLEETKAGADACLVEDAKRILKQWYEEYKTTGKVRYKGDPDKLDRHSYKEMARQYAEVLGEITR